MLNLNKIKGIIFDLDGVLIDTESYQSRAWIEALKTYSISLSEGDLLPYKGKSAEVIENELKKKYRLNIKKRDLVKKRDECILKIYKKEKIKLMPYAKEILAFFSHHKKLALASTGFQDEVFLKLKKSGLYHYFSVIVSRDDVKRGKPYPDIYLFAAKKLSLKPQQCLAFEDTQYGLESAKSAGLFCFAIPSEYSLKQDFSKADKIFKSLKEVVNFLSKPKKVVVMWDFDGTLVDTMPSHTRLASEVINKHFGLSKEKAKQEYLKTTGFPFDIQLKMIFPKSNGEKRKLCAEEYHRRKLKEVYKNFKNTPNAKNTIHQLYKLKIPQVITSGTDENIVYEWIKREKIKGMTRVTGREEGVKFDHIKKIKKEFKNYSIIFVGDSLNDMKLPVDFKIGFISKRDLKTKEGLKKYKKLRKKADIVIKNLKIVPSIVKIV
jgi:HAD superfamily hydrolase (TIGR01509 family)